MESQNHLMNTIGPMYVEEQRQKALQEAALAHATAAGSVAASPATEAAPVAEPV